MPSLFTLKSTSESLNFDATDSTEESEPPAASTWVPRLQLSGVIVATFV